MRSRARQRSVTVKVAPRPTEDPDTQALRLRRLGLSYAAIAVVMGEYHGIHHGERCWRKRLRPLGAQPIRHDYVGQGMPAGLARYHAERRARVAA